MREKEREGERRGGEGEAGAHEGVHASLLHDTRFFSACITTDNTQEEEGEQFTSTGASTRKKKKKQRQRQRQKDNRQFCSTVLGLCAAPFG